MLSALSIPLPGIEYRLMGATRRRIFHSAAPADLSPAGFSFLEERYGYHSWLNHFFSEVSNPYLPAMLTKALLSGCPFTVFFPRHLAEILWLNNSFPDEASHGIVFPPLTFQVNYWPSSFSTDCPAMNFFLSISRHYGRLTQLASSYLFFTMMAFTPPHLFVHRNELKMINRSFYFRNK
jgi:hypothetical protein